MNRPPPPSPAASGSASSSKSSKAIKPRALLHRGVVKASAILLETNLLGEQLARRRVLAAWRPGMVLERCGPGYLLRLSQPNWIDSNHAAGTPLVSEGDALLTAPLSSTERSGLVVPRGAVVRVSGGVALVETEPGERIDPSKWIDLASFPLEEVRPLGAPPPPPMPAAPVVVVDRSQFRAPAAAEELASVIAALQNKLDPKTSTQAATALALATTVRAPKEGSLSRWWKAFVRALQPDPEPDQVGAPSGSIGKSSGASAGPLRIPRWLERLRDFFSVRSNAGGGTPSSNSSNVVRAPLSGTVTTRPLATANPGSGGLWSWLRNVFGGRKQLVAPSNNTGAIKPGVQMMPPSAQAIAPRRAGFWERFRRALADMVMSSKLGEVVGKKQAEYLDKMMQMFQNGDLDQALRHAIPLSAMPGSTKSIPALGMPRPRSTLNIGAGPIQAASSTLASNVYEQLRALYRNAVQKLESEGRIEEAAFVLAELLQQTEEAVTLLEKHGRFKLAADLAEGRNLPPEQVIRQLLLAGEIGRAVALARKSGAFATTVLRLEKSEPERGKALRLLWAETLAEAGDFAGAVNVAWSVTEARKLARVWAERALLVGGMVEASMLTKMLDIVPESFPKVRDRMLTLFAEDGFEGAPVRRALADALYISPRTPETNLLLRAALRSQLRDVGRGHAVADARWLTQLCDRAGDEALLADMPKGNALAGRNLQPDDGPRFYEIAPTDAGTLAITDVARLPSGRTLLALGEGGVLLLTPDGRRVTHWDRPCTHLVVSDLGTRAITLVKRGPNWLLGRIDLVTLQAQDWCEAELHTWARDYDGSQWFASRGDELFSLDATSSKLRSIWRVGQLGGAALAIARSSSSMSALVTDAKGSAQLWQYELPKLILRSRAESPHVKSAEERWRTVVVQQNLKSEPKPSYTLSASGELAALYKVFDTAPYEALRLDLNRPEWKDSPALFTAPTIRTGSIALGHGCVAAVSYEPERAVVHVLSGAKRPPPGAPVESRVPEVVTFELSRSKNVSLRFGFGIDASLTIADELGRVLVFSLNHRLLLRNHRV